MFFWSVFSLCCRVPQSTVFSRNYKQLINTTAETVLFATVHCKIKFFVNLYWDNKINILIVILILQQETHTTSQTPYICLMSSLCFCGYAHFFFSSFYFSLSSTLFHFMSTSLMKCLRFKITLLSHQRNQNVAEY